MLIFLAAFKAMMTQNTLQYSEKDFEIFTMTKIADWI